MYGLMHLRGGNVPLRGISPQFSSFTHYEGAIFGAYNMDSPVFIFPIKACFD